MSILEHHFPPLIAEKYGVNAAIFLRDIYHWCETNRNNEENFHDGRWWTYHNGSGTVSGVSGGGNYSLQSKTVTPTKLQQNVTPDSGYYGLDSVTVAAIPESYQDVSAVTAEAGDVLTGKVFVDADGVTATGSMPNNGELAKTIDGLTVTSIELPARYTSGGSVKLTNDIEEALAAI